MAENHHRDWKQSIPGLRLAAPLLLTLVIVGFHWKLVLTNQFTWLASDDLSAQVLPWMQFQASEWRAGRFSLWTPYEWTGQPLLAQAQPGSLNPLHWLLFATPLKHGWIRQSALHWHYVLIRILAALSFYWLCRTLGRSRAASLFAGAVYGTAGYVGSVDWPQLVSGAIPVPLVFLFQSRAITGPARLPNAILSGFFLGLTWLSGHHQLPFYITLTTAVLWVYFIFNKISNYKYALYSLVTSLLVSAAQTFPTNEYGRLAVRWSGADHPLAWHESVPYSIHQLYSLKPISLWSILVPGLDLNLNPFIGAVAFAVTLSGLVAGWRDPRVRVFAVAALASVLFALGSNSLLHGIVYSVVPFAEKARTAPHALIVFHAGACALIAWGVDHFPSLPRRHAAAISGTLGAFGALLATTGLILALTRTLPLTADSRFMVTAFAAILAAGILWAWSMKTIAAPVAITILAILALTEIGNTGGNYVFASYDQKDRTAALRRMAEDGDLVEYLRNAPGHPFRVDYDGEAFPHNIGDWWGIEAFSVNVPSAPEIVMRNHPWNPLVQAMMGVRYYLGSKPLRDGQQEVFTGASGRKIFRNPAAFPRAWAVHSTSRVPPADTARLLTDPSFDLASRAIVTAEHPPLESCSGDSVRVLEHLPDRVTLEADMQCRGLVVVTDTWFPGWRAAVDGSKTEILNTNGFVRGVIVEKGFHRVEMRYQPNSFRLGIALTLTGTLLALLATISLLQTTRRLNYS